MNLEVQLHGHVAIMRLRENRLIFPQLETFAATVRNELDRGAKNVILNLSDVNYLDSPAHGVLFDLFRMVKEGGGTMILVGLQPRVEAMASLVGLTKVLQVHPDEQRALASLTPPGRGEKTPPA